MKLVMITVGSRGEVEPCVTLGAALQAEGHDVVIATHPNFSDFIKNHGVAFALINIDIDAFHHPLSKEIITLPQDFTVDLTVA